MNPLIEKSTKIASFEWFAPACGKENMSQANIIEQHHFQNSSLF